MPSRLTVTSEVRPDGVTAVAVTGEIDMRNCDVLRQELDDADQDDALEIDLTGVDYLDSAALSVLFAHSEHLELLVPELLLPLFDISGLSQVATVRRVGLVPPGL